MEQLYWKEELEVECPHCGYTSIHVFYLNADELTCHSCNKEFNIELWAKDVEVRTSK